MSSSSPIRLLTERLIVELPGPEDAHAVLDYYVRNADHLDPWEPRRPPGFLSATFHRAQLLAAHQDYREDRALRMYVRPQSDPTRIIGSVGLSGFQRGAVQACSLGYGIDAAWQGKGVMREAVARVVDLAFEELGFHRVNAAYVPHNERSARLLRALGFVVEGYARSYVQIDGVWRDHVLTARISPRRGG